jgi:para-aminobenzoate synthetase/4-amino-4-deoxychorismate lyase
MDVPRARLIRRPLDCAATPQDVLRLLAGDPWPFALTGTWAGGGALVGAAPLRVAAPGEDPFALLDELPEVEAGADAADAAVGGGWFGWLGYGLGARVEQLAPQPPRPVPLPPFQLAYYDHLLHRDAAGRWWFEALATPARAAALERRLEELRARLSSRPGPLAFTPPPPFRIAAAGAAGHVAAVADCRERIAAGEIFQANVCLRFETAWEGSVAELFAVAGERLAPAYGAAFPAPWGGVASLSPELFLRRRGRAAETAPIKGTVARTGDPAQDAAARARLAASAKDHAENVMIVDLMRNDLGRVCAYGTVAAGAAPELEAHPGVWHLVSRVRGELRPGVGDGELVRAAFPPGSVTGAPKVEAMHVIAALEATGREAYTGAIGYASPLAGLELNVAIRTFEARDGRLWLGAGGGIVADSDPLRELDECHVKARPIVAAIGATLAEDEPHVAARPAPRPVAPPALSRTRHRPDPGAGVFETLLVRDGRAVRAPEHRARLAASVAALYGADLPGDLAERVAAEAARARTACRLRVTALPTGRAGDTLAVAVEAAPLPRRGLPVRLAPFALAGGLGAHKWRDRRLLDALSRIASERAETTPLLVEADAEATVLEAAWGNVFALEGELLLTPPADGRILPGVTRAALLGAAPAAGLTPVETPLTLKRLAAADAVLLSSALAGVVPALLPGQAADLRRQRPALRAAAALTRALTRRGPAATAGPRVPQRF